MLARGGVRSAAVVALATVLLTGCGGGSGHVRPAPPPGAIATSASGAPPSPTPASATAAASTPGQDVCVSATLARMTVEQQVGQLFVMGVTSTGPTLTELGLVAAHHLGGVILMGHTAESLATVRQISARLQGQANPATTAGVPLWVSVDQEGGQVQVLTGSGFSDMPSAATQGTYSPGMLRTLAATWGGQLKAAGINLDLAPVLDTVPASLGSANAPIGAFRRNFGTTPDTVAEHGVAFIDGLRDAGVQATGKHFPGLGRVRDNTDTTFGVTDSTTTRNDPDLAPFAAAVSDGVPVVMVSLATYTAIDGRRAAFSPTVMTTMLRGDLGFRGVIMSDSMAAAAVSDLTPQARALDFLTAGGTVVLDTNPGDIPAMVDAVVARARQDPAFRDQVQNDARVVLEQKHAGGVLTCPGTPRTP